MPTFIDRHRAETISHEQRRRLTEEARADHPDAGGARPIGHWLEDEWVYCVLEAPNIAAVCAHHHGHGLSCASVREMDELDGSRPISPADHERVRAAIGNYWHADDA